MKKSHEYLTSLPMSREVREIYFKKPLHFDNKVKEYLLQGEDALKNRNHTNTNYIIEHSDELLKVFDKLTSIYQLESENKIQQLKYFEQSILFLSLLTLFLVGFFIFRPANRRFEMRAKQITIEKDYSNVIIESSTNAIIAVGKDLKVKTFNNAAERIFGYSKEEMIGENSLLKIVPSMYHEAHTAGITNHFSTGVFKHKGLSLEIEAVRKNGDTFPIRVSFGEDENAQEKDRIVIANIQDISVEKEKEKLLITNEKIYKDLFELNKSIIILVNPTNGSIINVNKSAVNFYGYEKSKFLTLNISDINILPMEEIEEKMNLAVRNEQSYFEFVHVLSNNEQRSVRVNSTPTMYKGEIVLYVTITDISEELDAKNKLSSLEEEFNNFFELSINLHLIADTQGNIIQVNNACENILGYERNELIHTSFLDLIHPDDIKETVEEMKKLDKGEVIYLYENRYKHKEGKYVTLAWSATEDVYNKLIYASAQDVSALKLIELEKNNQERIIQQQSKMASMGEMIENIAHQWRQPLSVIGAASSGLQFKNEMNALGDGDIEHTMKHINTSVQHLSQTITDFRNFFKVNKTKNVFVLKGTFEKTFKLIESQFKTSNINVEKNIEEVTLFGFENELIQVFINILNNARDELVKKEQKVKLILIDTIIHNHSLDIYIKDNAGGIPNNIIGEIFDSHFTTKQDSNGTGIGLYMSKMIIDEHMNGSIEVSNVNFEYEENSYSGALFKICLPLLTQNKDIG
jgi:PAS domain S-box-containing protein